VLIEVGGEGNGARTEMDARSPDGVARLERVPPLYPFAAAQAATHVYAEAADAGRHGRDVLLVLLDHPGLLQVLAAAVRTKGPIWAS
jgi:hypothetical protein